MEPDVTVTMDVDKPPSTADAQKQKSVCFVVVFLLFFVMVFLFVVGGGW